MKKLNFIIMFWFLSYLGGVIFFFFTVICFSFPLNKAKTYENLVVIMKNNNNANTYIRKDRNSNQKKE